MWTTNRLQRLIIDNNWLKYINGNIPAISHYSNILLLLLLGRCYNLLLVPPQRTPIIWNNYSQFRQDRIELFEATLNLRKTGEDSVTTEYLVKQNITGNYITNSQYQDLSMALM